MKIEIYSQNIPLIPQVEKTTKITDKKRKETPITKKPRKNRGKIINDSKRGLIIDTKI